MSDSPVQAESHNIKPAHRSISEDAYIRCHRVVKIYRVGDHELVALRGIDFEMARGELVAIIGPSGAGKSSLLNLIGALDTPAAGKVVVDGVNLLDLSRRKLADYRLRHVGFIWQQINKNLLSNRTAFHNITLPMMLAGASRKERNAHAHELLEAVGLSDHAHKHPSALSGGQAQRVAIAVALANRPSLLLADEPTGALDRSSAQQIMQLIADIRRKHGLTILMVTHDMEIAAHADRVLTLRDGVLGQDVDQADDLKLDEGGRIQLPDQARLQLHDAARIALEIRPDGVLLRPEVNDSDGITDMASLHQDAAPRQSKRRFFEFRKKRS